MPGSFDRLEAALADRYAIERVIGAGGMATVYLARDLRHERRVAVKVLRPDVATTVGAERFLQEVRVTADLQHPHILPLFDSGQADGFLYFVMPYVEGESLRQRLVREGELPVPEAARLVHDVVEALGAAHAMGVVHRDIKPENVLLSGYTAMVTDFGVAKAVSEAAGRHHLTTEGVAVGTPAYMAPEQAAGEPNVDHRADIYAAGVLAYELLSGRPPFSGTTAQQILTAQVMAFPRPLRERRPTVLPALEAVVMRCLEKKPADRWQSAEEMLPELEAATTSTGGMTPTELSPASRSVQKKRVLLAWAVSVVVMAVVAAVAVWWALHGGAVRNGAGSGAAAADNEQNRLVVMPLENLTAGGTGAVWGEEAAERMVRAIDRPRPMDVVPAPAPARASTLPGASRAEVPDLPP